MKALSQLRISLPREAAEAVANLLTEEGGGIEQRDSETFSSTDEGITELLVWVPTSEVSVRLEKVQALLQSLKALGTSVDPWSWESEEVDPASWQETYKEYFQVTRISRQLLVKPTWCDLDSQLSDRVIELDPGMAFGTGLHASTRLAAHALERVARAGPPPPRILDLGTGTGILALAAARFWPGSQILAIDNDHVAVEVCRQNVERNGLSQTIEVRHCSATEVKGRHNLIVANLSHELLTELHACFRGLIDEFGWVILSGLLAKQADEVARLFCRDLSMEPKYTEEDEGWRVILLRARE